MVRRLKIPTKVSPYFRVAENAGVRAIVRERQGPRVDEDKCGSKKKSWEGFNSFAGGQIQKDSSHVLKTNRISDLFNGKKLM